MTMEASARYRSYGKHVEGAATTTIYTCPPNFTAKVELVFISNGANGNVAIGLKWDDADNGGPFNILTSYVINSYSFLQLSDAYLVMNAGDTLQMVTPSGSNIDAIVSVAEYFDPTQK